MRTCCFPDHCAILPTHLRVEAYLGVCTDELGWKEAVSMLLGNLMSLLRFDNGLLETQ